MVKCPNCGSIAQVVCVLEDDDFYSNEVYREYLCGCGCNWELTYTLTDVEILGIDKPQ